MGKQFCNHHNYYELKYEHLCLSPESQISSLCSWLGLSFDQNMIKKDFIADDPRANFAHFSRLNSEINSSSCGRHKTVMKDNDVQRFLSVAAAELLHCGYEAD